MTSTPAARIHLVWPALEHLDSYRQALERGWSPDNVRGALAAREELERIAADAQAFIASLVDREARGGPITLPDGSSVPRLPGYRRWILESAESAVGEFCGSIGFRWQPGTSELPAYVLGHIGYAIVPWKRRRGHASAALRAILLDAQAEGLRWVEITTDADNLASQGVITAAGGVLVEAFDKPAAFGGAPSLRYRIPLAEAST